MTWALVGLALAAATGWAAFGAIALRLSTVRANLAAETAARDAAEAALKDTAAKLATTTQRYDTDRAAVEAQIRALEERLVMTGAPGAALDMLREMFGGRQS